MNNQEILDDICSRFKKRISKWDFNKKLSRKDYMEKCMMEVNDIMEKMEIKHLHIPILIKVSFVNRIIDVSFFLQEPTK